MLKKISGKFAIVAALILLSFISKAQDKNSSSAGSTYFRLRIGSFFENIITTISFKTGE